MGAYPKVSLTEPQKQLILTMKTNGGVLQKTVAEKFDTRVVNNLLRRGILRVENGALALVEDGVTTQEKKALARRGNPRPCYCGCGKTTRGGRFCTGHDGRLHAKVKRYVKTGECLFDANYREAKDYMKSVHWMTPEMWEVVSRA